MSSPNGNAVISRPDPGARRAYPVDRVTSVISPRPSSTARLLLIAVFVLPVSLVPSSYGTVFHFPLMPLVWWTLNLILIFAFVVFFFRLLGGFRPRMARSTLYWLVLPVLLMAALQVISLFWNGRDSFMRRYSFLQTASMCAAVLSGVWLTSGLPRPARLRLARGVTILLAFVIAVYMGLSFVFPSWRPSSAWVDWTTGSLGFIRVFGPLGKSTSLLFVLLPAFGFAAGMVSLPGYARSFWALVTVFFLVAILATGSRGGVLCLAAFAFLLMLSLRMRAVIFLVAVGIFLGGLLAFTGIPQRFRDIEDSARTATYRTALRTFAASPRNVIVGAGHGALYSKLHDDTLRKLHGRDRWYLLEDRTAHGYTLRNSHSALMRSLVETGVLGFLLFLTMLAWLLKRLLVPPARRLRDRYRTHALCTLAGCAATIPYMMFEEFLVGAFWIVFLWTLLTVVGSESVTDDPVAPESL